MASLPQPTPQLFGILPTGLAPITTPSASPTPTSFLYTLPSRPRPYNHIAVFLLPGTALPPDCAAAVYLLLPSSAQDSADPHFKFLGAIGEGKESAFFKIGGLVGSGEGGALDGAGVEVAQAELTLGISLESTSAVAAQITQQQQQQQQQSQASGGTPSSKAGASAPTELSREAKVGMAQKIIRSAFHFLASYSGNLQNGVEVVPLKAFEEWWRRFEGRVRSDPGFLEGEEGG